MRRRERARALVLFVIFISGRTRTNTHTHIRKLCCTAFRGFRVRDGQERFALLGAEGAVA